MARYIDADDLLKALKEERKNGNFVFTSKWIKEIMDNLPIADVVPKSEVERLQNILDSYALQYGTVMDKHIVIEKAREEVAREIFKEMQSCLIQRHWNGLDIVSFEFDAVKYAELKKKYTKEE